MTTCKRLDGNELTERELDSITVGGVVVPIVIIAAAGSTTPWGWTGFGGGEKQASYSRREWLWYRGPGARW
jgi:hypothetical protein